MRWISPILFGFFAVVNGQKKEYKVQFTYPTLVKNEKCAADGKESYDLQWSYTSTNPIGPIVPCRFLPETFISCEDPIPLYGQGQTGPQPANESFRDEGKCLKMGGFRAEDVEFTNVKCRVLPCIECRGPRIFRREKPCIIYTGHYFLTTLLYSIFLGVVAVDRFCLGYSAMAVGKLMTLGGFGIWWIVDIFLLVLGHLGPADDSNWEPYY